MARLALVLLLVLAAPARALTVSETMSEETSVQQFCSPESGVCLDPYTIPVHRTEVRLDGAAVDAHVDVTDQFVTVTDAGVQAGEGCDAVDTTTVRCQIPPPSDPSAQYVGQLSGTLGPGDDRLSLLERSSDWAVTVDGGAGDDTLDLETGAVPSALDTMSIAEPVAIGGSGDDRLTAHTTDGGDGSDHLTATGFVATADGGLGDDVLDDSDQAAIVTFRPGPGRDVVTGRGASERVDDSEETAPQVIDLTGAGRGGSDLITGVHGADGGPGDDLLIAGSAGSELNGGPGADRIFGGVGDDELFGGPGRDHVSGGRGDDILSADAQEGRDGAPARDTVQGGAGADRLYGTRGREVLSGGPGDDEVQGGGGRDRIELGAGDDAVYAPGAARVHCGPGRDEVSDTHVSFALPDDCERVSPFDFVPAVARPHFVAPHWLDVPLDGRCPYGRGCTVTVHIRVFGQHRVHLDGRRRVVRFFFPRAYDHGPLTIGYRARSRHGRITRAGFSLIVR